MVTIAYATTNDGKAASLRHHLTPAGIEVAQYKLIIPEPRMESVDRLAKFKVMIAQQEIGGSVVANDSGFYIRDLKGYPGANVNFALKTHDIEGILRMVVGTLRYCEFRSALAYDNGSPDPDLPVVFSDVVCGTIAPEPRGVFDRTFHWSKLATIFIPEGQKKTLGEMSYDEYQYWSEHYDVGHRYYDHFLRWFRNHAPVTSNSD